MMESKLNGAKTAQNKRNLCKKSFPTSLFIGLALGFALGSPAAQAVEGILAQRCTSPILLNGAPVEIEAYTINGHNYFKLRDIGKAVGFNVYWIAEDRTVQIETGQPYTGEAPIRTEDVESDLQSEPNASTVDVDFMKQDIVERTNALRAERGIASLTTNDKLMQAAQVRADEMAANSVYSHTRPDGREYTTVTDCKYVGENIHRIADWALQDKTVSEVAVWSWNRSAGHQDNLLDKTYAEIGVGLARGVNDDGYECWYCVQLFLRDGYTIAQVDSPSDKTE